MQILKPPQLLALLEQPSERLRRWATYQLLEHWQDHADEFAGTLFKSELEDVREAGVYLIGRQRLERFAFPLLGWFNRSTGELRRACTTALTDLCPPNFPNLLNQWLEQLLDDDELQLPNLQCAVENLLRLEGSGGWETLEQHLATLHGQHLKALCLFRALCKQADSGSQVYQLMEHYTHFRSHTSDPQFLQHLAEIFGGGPSLEFLRLQLEAGATFRTVTQIVAQTLGHTLDAPTEALLQQADKLLKTQDHPGLAPQLLHILKQLAPEDSTTLEQGMLEGFRDHITPNWDDAIIRIQEQEFFLLRGIPLIALVRHRALQIAKSPTTQLPKLQRLLRAPLLDSELLRELTEHLLERTPLTAEQQATLAEAHPHTPLTPQEAVLVLLSGTADPNTCSFPTLLPKPWQFGVPELSRQLTECYLQHFETLVAEVRHDHLDYALQLFTRHPAPKMVELLITHFHFLINQHYHTCFDFIERNPDPRFIAPLTIHHREGEAAVGQLLFLLCTAHGEPLPEGIDAESAAQHGIGDTLGVRIPCGHCHTAYHYGLSLLYYNPDAIEQRQPFSNDDLWTPDTLVCKNCGTPLRFQMDTGFRSGLYMEILTAHLLRLSEDEAQRLANIRPLRFPKFLRRTMHPGKFLLRVTQELETKTRAPEERAELLIELGRLRLELGENDAAQEALQQSMQLGGKSPDALFHLGVIAFQRKNLFEARLHFSQLVQTTQPEDFSLEEANLHQLASHYLNMLEHREVRRSGFQIMR
ncbi:MAG: hypothetical protein CL923_07905 [Deltaproteobacteria bacterium]|nr:hypothetical protein [Deltaproteobacteria bacterium]MDP7630319.1 tetratricopeptide repeat protein [SAR324 cluster bacterium]